jgi:hypothetical protein
MLHVFSYREKKEKEKEKKKTLLLIGDGVICCL